MAQKLIHTNVTYSKGKGITHYNAFYGCDVYEYDLIPGDLDFFIYIPLKDDGTPVVSSKTGYTKLYEVRKSAKTFYRIDGEIDIPVYGEMSFDDIVNHVDVGSSIFFTSVKDSEGVLIGIENLSIYSKQYYYACEYESGKLYKYGSDLSSPLEVYDIMAMLNSSIHGQIYFGSKFNCRDVAVMSDGTIVLADTLYNRVWFFDSEMNYLGNYVDIGLQETDIESCEIGSDGKLYIGGRVGDSVYGYTLTAFDNLNTNIGTHDFTNNVSAQATLLMGLRNGADGKWYITDGNAHNVIVYSSAWVYETTYDIKFGLYENFYCLTEDISGTWTLGDINQDAWVTFPSNFDATNPGIISQVADDSPFNYTGIIGFSGSITGDCFNETVDATKMPKLLNDNNKPIKNDNNEYILIL